MRGAGVGRRLALAISFLLVGVAGGNAGHALAGIGGHGLGSAALTTDAPSNASDPAPPHDGTNCLLCRAARVSSLMLNTSASITPAIAGECSAMSLPEALAPSTPQRRAEAARAPPARLVV
jgi:hypothetical protein